MTERHLQPVDISSINPAPRQELVDYLEELTEQAKSGALRSLAICYIKTGQIQGINWSLENVSYATNIIGGLERLQAALIEEINEAI